MEKKKAMAAAAIALVMIISLFTLISIEDASAQSNLEEMNWVTNKKLNGDLIDLSDDDDPSNRSGMKTMNINIEGMTINPSYKDMIYQSVDTIIRVRMSNARPQTVRIFFDSANTDQFLTYSRTGGFDVSIDIREHVAIIHELCRVEYNDSLSLWELDFAVIFQWSYPSSGMYSISIIASDERGYIDELMLPQVYRFEKNLVMGGEIVLSSTDPEAITPDARYIRGNSYLVISGISLHFKGNTKVSPLPGQFKMGVFDDRGNYWDYIPTGTKDLNKITFSFQVPNMDGITRFKFLVHTMPETVYVNGKIEFDINIDSTSPKIWDFKLSKDDGMRVSWKYLDGSSGLAFSSLRIRLERSSPRNTIEWYKPEDVRWFQDIVEITLDIPPGDYFVQIMVKDNVGNVNPYEDSYYFSTIIRPVHDVSIDGHPYYYPTVLIAGYESQIHYSITNRGSYDEYDIETHFYIDGKLHDILLIGELSAGSTRELRFHYRPSLSSKEMKLVIDPNSRIMDEDLSNNEMITEMMVHYRDLNIDRDSFTSSNPHPADMEQISINLRVNNIGDLESGIVKIIFLEDERFHGEYHIGSIPGGSWDILSMQWKANHKVKMLSFIIDPYNEIFESDENNRFDITNPFHIPITPSSKDTENNEVAVIDGGEEHIEVPIYDPQTSGKTVWIGPITEDIRPPEIVDTEIIQPEPPLSGKRENIPLFTIPLIGFTITSTMLAGLLLFFKNEPIRFKLMMMAIPLYSKLKKTKIEQGTRYEILGYLKARPGANYTELKENLDLNDGSLIHHLRILEREEKVYSKRVGKFKLFYVTSYRREPSISDYISPVQKRILELIYQNPGIVPKTLSGILDRSQTDISYHLTELSRNGFLEKKKKGKNIQYYLKDEYLEAVLS